MSKKTIGIDLDDTLNNLMETWLALYNRDYGDTLAREGLSNWDTWKFVKPECGKKIYRYVKKPSTFLSCQASENAREVTEWLAERYDLYIVTAYNPKICNAKARWLKKNFPRIDQNNIIFANNKSLIGTDFLIDDGPHNILGFKGEGLLFDAPWNRHLGSDFPRMSSWLDVKRFFEALEA